MTTFLTYVGVIALFILGKFIYDSYLTQNTEKRWSEYTRSNPESAARIERNRGLDFSTKSKSREWDKRESLLRMAERIGCSPEHVKEIFIKELKDQQLTAAQTKEVIQMCRQNKYEESRAFNIDPADTGASYLEEWTNEYFKNKEYANRKRTEREIAEDLMTENPELDRIVKSADDSQIHDFLRNNPDVLDSMLEDLAFADKPAEKYRRKAIDKMYDDKDYIGAIKLINIGLEFDEPQSKPALYELRADCAEKLLNYNDALKDMNKAIESIIKNLPDNYYAISEFYKKRGEIRLKLDDIAGANQDVKSATEYYAKYEANKIDNDVVNRLPF